MRILHTSDWHIGKTVNEFSMLDDQEYFLDKMIETLISQKIDVLLISGDIYDRSVPPAPAVVLLNRTLQRIVEEIKIPVVAIAGNHDSPYRLDFGSGLFKKSGLFLEAVIKDEVEKVVLKDEYGDVNFYLLPFFDCYNIRSLFSDCDVKNDNEAFSLVAKKFLENVDFSGRNVLLAHGYFEYLNGKEITNEVAAEFKENRFSEFDISLGSAELIDISPVEDFDYVALGHIHSPQKIKKNNIRYSGALLKYSKDEASQKRSLTIIDLKEKGNIEISSISIKPKRDMIIIKGDMATLLDKSSYTSDTDFNSYVFAVLTDEGVIFDAMNKLRSVFPNIMGISFERFDAEKETVDGIEHSKNKKPIELFENFYRDITDKEIDEEKKEIISRIFDDIAKEQREK